MLKAQGQRQFSWDPKRYVFTIPCFQKYLESLVFSTSIPTSVRCSDVSPSSWAWLLEAAGTSHLQGWAFWGRWPWATRLESGCGCWWHLENLLWMGSWPSAILLGKVPSPPLPRHGEEAEPETPHHAESHRRLPVRQAEWLSWSAHISLVGKKRTHL